LGLIVGDNLAVNGINGFVQSFNSKMYCRACTKPKAEMKLDTEQSESHLRNKINYAEPLSLNNFQETGVKSVCIFNDLTLFHVVENICFDIMHDVFEGVCIYDVCNILCALIKDKFITIDELNCRKNLFKYGETEIGNKSKSIELEKLKNFHLGMNATQMFSLVHFLTLEIGDLIPEGNRSWELLLTLLDILDLLLQPVIIEENIRELQMLVCLHHRNYLDFWAFKAQTSFSSPLLNSN